MGEKISSKIKLNDYPTSKAKSTPNVIMKISYKIVVVVLVVLFGWHSEGAAQTVQYVSLETTNASSGVQYQLQTNQVVSLVGLYGYGTVWGNFADGQSMIFPSPASGQPQLFTGFTSITAKANANQIICPALQITTPTSVNVISNYVPADAIVIPASAAGNVQIILESSTDLVNWTAASPGTYGPSSATNRFFRVRAVFN